MGEAPFMTEPINTNFPLLSPLLLVASLSSTGGRGGERKVSGEGVAGRESGDRPVFNKGSHKKKKLTCPLPLIEILKIDWRSEREASREQAGVD